MTLLQSLSTDTLFHQVCASQSKFRQAMGSWIGLMPSNSCSKLFQAQWYVLLHSELKMRAIFSGLRQTRPLNVLTEIVFTQWVKNVLL